MLAEEPSAELIRGFMVGDGFDQIWARRGANGEIIEYIIVEAKGPGAQLGETVNKVREMITTSGDYGEFLTKLNQWADRALMPMSAKRWPDAPKLGRYSLPDDLQLRGEGGIP
jgi:hypothetical protein